MQPLFLPNTAPLHVPLGRWRRWWEASPPPPLSYSWASCRTPHSALLQSHTGGEAWASGRGMPRSLPAPPSATAMACLAMPSGASPQAGAGGALYAPARRRRHVAVARPSAWRAAAAVMTAAAARRNGIKRRGGVMTWRGSVGNHGGISNRRSGWRGVAGLAHLPAPSEGGWLHICHPTHLLPAPRPGEERHLPLPLHPLFALHSVL